MRFDDNDKKKMQWDVIIDWEVRFECDKSDSKIVVNEDCDKDEDWSHV
jgi:hypothetical protein